MRKKRPKTDFWRISITYLQAEGSFPLLQQQYDSWLVKHSAVICGPFKINRTFVINQQGNRSKQRLDHQNVSQIEVTMTVEYKVIKPQVTVGLDVTLTSLMDMDNT